MPFTAPRTWVANVTAITAAALNTDLRDNLNYLKGLVDGTGGAVTVTVPYQLAVANDGNFRLWTDAFGPHITLDTDDKLHYDRANNTFAWYIGAALKLSLNTYGELKGAGFYDSGALTIADTATSNLSHGLAFRPRFVFGYYTSVSVAPLDGDSTTGINPIVADVTATSVVHFTTISATTISVRNLTGGTRYARVYAMV
jgi:hypothetical protein